MNDEISGSGLAIALIRFIQKGRLKTRNTGFQTTSHFGRQDMPYPSETISICSMLRPRKRSPMVRKRRGMSLT
ncbi:hypothetical protein [Neisseria sicca]|uniref:hypothetical protein n=1 Tax=Neisseria sicca TaxID=490 RepID=UPI0011BD1A68|nr:hypothetical protein [Neisseria sicca]